jgi:hypothetical protein
MRTERCKWVVYLGIAYKGYYKITNRGQITSVSRNIIGRTKHGKQIRSTKERILKPFLRRGYLAVTLYQNGLSVDSYVHLLVLETFVGPCPEGLECCHQNNIKTDNR